MQAQEEQGGNPNLLTEIYRFISLDNDAGAQAMRAATIVKRRWVLKLRQQPKHSRKCGIGEKVGRRPLDPAPVVQLEIHEDPCNSEYSPLVDNPYYFMYATLLSPHTGQELRLLRDGRTRTTTGSTISALVHLKDDEYREGSFFAFPDLGVRMEGTYRLKFSLFEIVGPGISFCASICSDEFEVLPAKKFSGMMESTPLIRAFAEQGLRIRIRKTRKLYKKRSLKSSKCNSDTDSSSEDERERKKPSLKAKGRIPENHYEPGPRECSEWDGGACNEQERYGTLAPSTGSGNGCDWIGNGHSDPVYQIDEWDAYYIDGRHGFDGDMGEKSTHQSMVHHSYAGTPTWERDDSGMDSRWTPHNRFNGAFGGDGAGIHTDATGLHAPSPYSQGPPQFAAGTYKEQGHCATIYPARVYSGDFEAGMPNNQSLDWVWTGSTAARPEALHSMVDSYGRMVVTPDLNLDEYPIARACHVDPSHPPLYPPPAARRLPPPFANQLFSAQNQTSVDGEIHPGYMLRSNRNSSRQTAFGIVNLKIL
ncbi:hypothetical protein HK102_011607 [Quaeritorhiza haematococci]|nr:hypothetical protein HK102_011607 [Quaeritorhiza haematococci]